MTAEINGIQIEYTTHPSLFSPSGLDRGTAAMLRNIVINESDKVLDLGCGTGIVGIYASKITPNVVMCDVDPAAVNISRENCEKNSVSPQIIESDGLKSVEDRDFTLILSNPPYHTDFSVPKEFIENGFRHLSVGGRMVMVTKRLDWYKNKLTAVFGGVRIVEDDGYYIFISEKRTSAVKQKEKKKTELSRKLRRKYDK